MAITKEQQFELALREYKRDIRLWARTKWRIIPGYEQADLEAEMLAVLWKAVMTYDPHNGSKFANWFRTLRDREYTSIIRKIDADKRTSEKRWGSLDADPTTTESGYWTEIDRSSLSSLLAPSSEETYLEREEAAESWLEAQQTA